MKKIFLLCMLLMGYVGVSWAQFSVKYDLSQITFANYAQMTPSQNRFDINITDNTNGYWGGYNNGWGEWDTQVRVTGFNLNNNGTTTNVQLLAFNPTKIVDSWAQDEGQKYTWRVSPSNDANEGGERGIKNYSPHTNVFSVLNLRAGEIVKVKTHDYINRDKYVKDRFIVNHSANAADNLPWSNGTDKISWIHEWEQQFVMLEDGNLDLKVAPWVKIETVEIISSFQTFHNERAHVGTPINVTIPCRKFQTANYTYRFNMIEPVVCYYGDLTPGTVTVSKTNADENNGNTGQFTINISGFTGKQSSDGYWEGGAIVVMLDQDMYTFTVPYNVNKEGNAEFARWNFWQEPLSVGRASQPVYQSLMSHDVMEGSFGLVYENTDNREPLYEYNGRMYGQNAYYHPETAGLIFETNANKQYGILNENEGAEPDGNRYLGLKNGSSLTVPELKAGDEVWVYFDHFGAAEGRDASFSSIGMTVSNAKDALGKSIDPNEVIVAGGSTWGPSFFGTNKEAKIYVGAMHFYAAADGDMKFTPRFKGNYNILKICYVRLVKHNPQNIISKTNSILWYNDGGPNSGYELLTTQDANGTYHNTYGSWGLHDCGRGQSNQKFQVLEASGNLSAYEINQKINDNYQLTDGIGQYSATNGTNGKKFKYTTKNEPTFGSFLLRAMDYDHNGKYCFDYADRVIAVGYRQTMNYPYTWDFTDILNTNTGNSQAEYDLSAAKSRPEGGVQPAGVGLYGDTKQYNGQTIWMNDTTSVWVKDENNVISLQNARIRNENNRTLSSGTQLFASDTYIEEAAGLGWATINMDAGFNGSIQILEGGVKIQSYNGWETRLFVPNVNKDGRIFIRGKKLNDGIGFVAKAYKNAAMGPNTFKKTPDTRVNLTALTVNQEVTPLFVYAGEFNTLFDEPNDVTTNKQYDDHLTAHASADKNMLEKNSSSRTVNNSRGVFTRADHQIVTETREDADGNQVVVVVSDNGIYRNNDGKNAIYDSDNVTTCDDYDDVEYTKLIDTRGSGQSSGDRTLQITMPEGKYKVTVVARSSNPRQINIYGGDWGSNLLGQMIAGDELMAKSIETTSTIDKLTIGSDNSGIEIYAIYVTEIRSEGSSSTAAENYSGYVDVAASDGGVTFYLNDITIEKIGYSTDLKELNDIGWASESRDHYIDHSLTEYFTTNPVKAYLATGTARSTEDNLINGVVLTEVVKPMELSEEDATVNSDQSTYTGTGCILYNTNKEGVEGGVNLFVPDIHDYMKDDFIKTVNNANNANFKGDALTNGSAISNNTKTHANAAVAKINAMTDNQMIANLSGHGINYSGVNDPYTYYVLSYKYTTKDGKQHPTADEEPSERFVRVAKGGATGKANTAFLRLPTASVKPEDYVGESNLIIIFEGDEQTDGIDEINTNNIEGGKATTTDSYYSISGQKIDKPTTPGVYVKNGKKVYVK